ncbi:MAG: sigma-70 family RNA polymerase sigma factor [Planctomycetes bacterium]|nr:sigma-70 family RNA polymerase sigma factor [Planctomycetota bacterium]
MDTDEKELIRQAVAGSAIAVQLLLVRHHASLAAHLQHHLPRTLAGSISVEDICQEAYIAVMRKIAEFNLESEGGFFAWIRTIAERKLTDAIRASGAAKRQAGKRLAAPVGGEATSRVALLGILAVHEHTPSRSLARREGVEHVQAGLGRLEGDYREALRLRYIMGLSVADVAQRMDRTEGAVKMLCNRGLRQLGERLGDLSRFVSVSVDLREKSRGGQ